VVSHDREFLNNVVTSALIFTGKGTVNEYVGGYDDWERQIPKSGEQIESEEPVQKEKKPEAVLEKKIRKISQKEKRELESLPAQIETLEKEVQEINTQLADYTLCQKPGFVAQSKSRISEIEAELAKNLARWETLEKLPKTDK
jgi:ATP-binding cassette subfamily F protein uup